MAAASSPCHTGLRRRQPGLLHVLRPRRPPDPPQLAASPPPPRVRRSPAPPRGRTTDWPAGGSSRRAPASAAPSSDWWPHGEGRGGRGPQCPRQSCAAPPRVDPCPGTLGGPSVLGGAWGTRELCTGWDLGKPQVLSLWHARRIRSWTRLRNYGKTGLGWTLERGWALREPWTGLWHRGGSQLTVWLWQTGRVWVGPGTAPAPPHPQLAVLPRHLYPDCQPP